MTLVVIGSLPSQVEYPVPVQEKTEGKSVWKERLAKVWRVVKIILLVIANAVCFLTNPALYPLAFFAGFVFRKTTQKLLDRIFALWKKIPWAVAIVAVAGLLAIHYVWAVLSGLVAAHLGSLLSQKAKTYLLPE